ncbi:alpha/beta fold hydrolase [Roseivirga pacifica]|uniref:alpha/beta fold hydrolase n=1 Tax=Roseivirga pacifica TaxID=1267423 RepID=UPI003BB1CCEA
MKKSILKLSMACLILLGMFTNQASANNQPGLKVEVSGKGQPIILIPGITCAGDVWDETLTAMGDGYQYHVMTLPGFAGNVPLNNVETEGFFSQVEAMILNYIAENKLKKPIIIGHSLGGFLALKIGISNPDLPSKLVIVDSLPFLAGIQMPYIQTEEQATQFAKQVKATMIGSNSQSQEEQMVYQKEMLKSMIRDEDKIAIAAKWGAQSDVTTIAQAMYEMYATDLRQEVAEIKAPTLVLGAWIAYKNYGVTRESCLASYKAQYQAQPNVTVDLTDNGNHFIMWDDPEFFYNWLNKFL